MKKTMLLFALVLSCLFTGCAGRDSGAPSRNTIKARDTSIEETQIVYSLEQLQKPAGFFHDYTILENKAYLLHAGGDCIVSSIDMDTMEAQYVFSETAEEYHRISAISALDDKLYILSDGNCITEYDLNGNGLRQFTLTGQNMAMYLEASGDTLYTLGDGKLDAWKVDGDELKLAYSLPTELAASIGKLRDGRVVVCQGEGSGASLKVLDDDSKSWGESRTIDICCGITGVGTDGKLLLGKDENIYAFYFDDGKIEKLFSLTQYGIKTHSKMFEISDGNILYLGKIAEEAGGPLVFHRETIPVDTEKLTIATIGGSVGPLRDAVLDWNLRHPESPIEIKDYSVFGTQAETRVMLDITAGETPDMYDFSLFGSPLNAPLLAQKGLLENIYPYLDNEPELSRGSFFKGPLSALEIDGGLYEVSPGFDFVTALSTPEFADVKNMDFGELEAAVKSNDYYQRIFDQTLPREQWLQMLIDASGSYLLDWEAGTSNFDSDYFIRLLEIAKTMSPNGSYSEGLYADKIQNSHAILFLTVFRNMGNAGIAPDAYGDNNYSFAGLPLVGNVIVPEISLGISQTSQHKELCWQFLRTFWTSGKNYASIPFRKDFARKQIEEEIERMKGYETEHPGRIQAMEELYTLLDGVSAVSRHDSRLYSILSSELPKFFNDRRSAEETAKQIQSKISIYISEQYG